MPLRFLTLVATSISRPRSNDHAPAEVRMSGSSSMRRFRRRLPEDWDRMFLTETMERRPDIGLDSYDRLFPNQDTMPHGGFGNLIALPLQRTARKQDNTVFLG
jgi:hypothetical protein